MACRCRKPIRPAHEMHSAHRRCRPSDRRSGYVHPFAPDLGPVVQSLGLDE
jgi:hypothetical protein